MRLRGRFLLCVPTAKSPHSFLSRRNSREETSSKGRISFLRFSILALGLSSIVCGAGGQMGASQPKPKHGREGATDTTDS